MKAHILTSEKDTQTLANELAKMNLTGSIWLSGDLGAGKTTSHATYYKPWGIKVR